jgi:O-antigen/teichoic acid export membrane protein
MAISGVLVALLVWTLAPLVVRVLGGPQYEPAAPVLQIQGFATVTIFFTAAWLPALMALNRLRSYWVAATAGILAVVVSGLILIPLYQATGAAVAAVIADVTLAGAMYLAVRRAAPGQWVSPAAMLRIAAATAVAVGLGLIGGIPSIPRAILVAGAFIATVLLLRTIPSEMLDALRAATERFRPAPKERPGSDS